MVVNGRKYGRLRVNEELRLKVIAELKEKIDERKRLADRIKLMSFGRDKKNGR